MTIRPAKLLLVGASVLYPFLIFYSIVYLDLSPRILSLPVFLVALGHLFAFTGKKSGGVQILRTIVLSLLLGTLAVAAFITNSDTVLRFYPVIMGVTLLTAFSVTLARPPSMILRFALMQDKTLASADAETYADAERYCIKVTIVWCLFFIVNTAIALYTTVYASPFVWSLYNGLISYILMGVLFAGEFVVRRIVRH